MFQENLIIFNGKSASGESEALARLIQKELPGSVVVGFYTLLANNFRLLQDFRGGRIIGGGGDGTHGTLGKAAAEVDADYLAIDVGSIGLFTEALGLRQGKETKIEYIQRLIKFRDTIIIQPGVVTSDLDPIKVMSMAGGKLVNQILNLVEANRSAFPNRDDRLKVVLGELFTATIHRTQPIQVTHNGVERLVSEATVFKHELAGIKYLPLAKRFPHQDVLLTIRNLRRGKLLVYGNVLRVAIDYILLHLGIRSLAGGLEIEPISGPVQLAGGQEGIHVDTQVFPARKNIEIVASLPTAQPIRLINNRAA